MAMTMNTESDLWDALNFDLFTCCWNFRGPVDPDGYGLMFYRGGKVRTHRAAWMFCFGEVPSDKQVCHSCDNPPCCNPAHLWLGTCAENIRDRDVKGRQASGQRNGRALLTDDQVRLIRCELAEGFSLSAVGRRFQVSPSVVWRIKHGVTWTSVS